MIVVILVRGGGYTPVSCLRKRVSCYPVVKLTKFPTHDREIESSRIDVLTPNLGATPKGFLLVIKWILI